MTSLPKYDSSKRSSHVSSYSADDRRKWYNSPKPELLVMIGKQQSDPMTPSSHASSASVTSSTSSSKYETDESHRPTSPYSNWVSKRNQRLSAASSKSSQDGEYGVMAAAVGKSSQTTVAAEQVMNRMLGRRSHSLDDRTAEPMSLHGPGKPAAMRRVMLEQDGRSWSQPTPSIKLPPILSKQVRFQSEQRQSLGAYRVMKKELNNDY